MCGQTIVGGRECSGAYRSSPPRSHSRVPPDIDGFVERSGTEVRKARIQTDADGVIRVGGTRVTLDTLVGAFDAGATAGVRAYLGIVRTC